MPFPKRTLLLILILGTWLTPHSHAADSKTNVLILNVDDLKPTLGCYGDETAITPNIDALAKLGTVMRYAYCQQAVCAPSRVSMYTGMRPDSTGVQDLHTDMRAINPKVLTMPQFYKQQGYHSIGFGKILHGAKGDDPVSWTSRIKDEDLVYSKGYDYPVLGKFQSPEIREVYMEMAANRTRVRTSELLKKLKSKEIYTATENIDLPDQAYADGAIAKAGCAKLRELAVDKTPFYLVLGFRKPHLPFNAPRKYWDLYNREAFEPHPFQEQQKDRPAYAYHSFGELGNYSDHTGGKPVELSKQKELIHGYYACTSFIDAQIGKVMDTMKETGLLKNTVIVLWGDHGWHLGDHGLWCKHSNFEQATATPLIFVAPGMRGNQVATGMAEIVDIFPTLTTLTGHTTPTQCEGDDLTPVLKDASTIVKDYAVSQYPRFSANGYTLRSGQYRVTMWMDKDFLSSSGFSPERVKGVELYDYKKDPMEKTNLIKNPEYEEVLKSMKKKMRSYFKKYRDEKKSEEILRLMKQHGTQKEAG